MRGNSANGTLKQDGWSQIDWHQANRIVRSLRQRIFQATRRMDWKTVRSLQKLMLRSQSNRQLSVRQVTQVNAGKNTPGVDKLTLKTPKARGELVSELAIFQPWKVKPVRRFFIPKANGKTRPLGIPTIKDRALQAMVKNALEPEWEAQFEAISYGFRPGRACRDAIDMIFRTVRAGLKCWVVDADIKGAFDHISHDFLLERLQRFPARHLIKAWMKAGVMEQGTLSPAWEGVPQGGVISPLLLNIALHGMEAGLGIRKKKSGQRMTKHVFLRYVDDWLVLGETREQAEKSLQDAREWLKTRGLTLSEEKTRIVSLSDGFDFLGFNIREYPTSTRKTGKIVLIKPSKKAIQNLKNKLKERWIGLLGQNVGVVIKELNPIIRGWANYYRHCVASQLFSELDSWMFVRATRFLRRTHPNKPVNWLKSRYWRQWNPHRQDHWVLGDPRTGFYLLKFRWTPIERYAVVKGHASPDDPSLREYWEWRRRSTVEASSSIRKLLRQQNYRCVICKETLLSGEEIHQHHKIPRVSGGGNGVDNLVLVHLYCHQQIHSVKRREIYQGQ